MIRLIPGLRTPGAWVTSPLTVPEKVKVKASPCCSVYRLVTRKVSPLIEPNRSRAT